MSKSIVRDKSKK